MATDPDADRVGIAVKKDDSYVLLTGNEVGVLMLDYIAKSRIQNCTMPKDPVTVKTIVTTKLIESVAKEYGVKVINILTGFKYIGEQIGLLEEKGEENRYIMGFEESYGYLTGTYVRDKDAVNASLMICEMAAYYKKNGLTLYQALENLYKKHGRYLNSQDNIGFEGAAGMKKMQEIMSSLRENPPKTLGGLEVVRISDYEDSTTRDLKNGTMTEIFLPKADVLIFDLEKDNQVVVRPSGTEPKIKVYYTAKADDLDGAKALTQKLSKDVKEKF